MTVAPPSDKRVRLELVRAELARRDLIERYEWPLHRRPSQTVPDGRWRTWLIMAGRGFGKTRTGAETVRAWSEETESIALIGRTLPDARELMVDGPSGILHVFPEWRRPEWVASRRLIRFPSGAKGHVYTSEEPDMLRGPQHQKIWADEAAAWVYPDSTWNMAMFGLRMPPNPQVVVTTTPKPIPLIKRLVGRAESWLSGEPSEEQRKLGRVVITSGSTHENADNLDPAFLTELLAAYEGTRLGRQEIEAELLMDMHGTLWRPGMITYRDPGKDGEDWNMSRVVVGVDPAATSGESADETGIVGAGIGMDGLGYVIDDQSVRGTPAEWGEKAVSMYRLLRADRIVAEVNNGGEMVQHVIHTIDPGIPVTMVHASRGKKVRAEPIAAKYEQHRVFHVQPLPLLEDQMTSWVPVESRREESSERASPDRVDALVWALTNLMLDDPWGGTASGIA